MYNNLRIFKDTLRFDTNDLTYMPYIGNLSRYKMGGMVGGISCDIKLPRPRPQSHILRVHNKISVREENKNAPGFL